MNTYDNIDIEWCLSEYGNMIYRLAYTQTKNREQADDVYQDVFLKLMQHKKKFDNNEHLKAWLIRTTLNCCKDLWKSAWFKRNVSYDELPEATVEMSVKDSYFCLTKCLKKLPSKYREIIHLYYYEEYTQKEIASILKINENTVATRMVRGRKLLQKYLNEEGENYEF